MSFVARVETVGTVLPFIYESCRHGLISCLQFEEESTLTLWNVAFVDMYLLSTFYKCFLFHTQSPSISCLTLKITLVWIGSPMELKLLQTSVNGQAEGNTAPQFFVWKGVFQLSIQHPIPQSSELFDWLFCFSKHLWGFCHLDHWWKTKCSRLLKVMK